MAERHILAYFRSMSQAEGAKRKLQALRVPEIRIDTIGVQSAWGDSGGHSITGRMTESGFDPYNSELDIKSESMMLAADPDMSGMSDRGDQELMGNNILMTVTVDHQEDEKALSIIHEFGGVV